MAEFLPACTYDGIDVGYNVGIYDKGMLFDSMAFSTVDTIVADGNLAKAESFGITDGVHYLLSLGLSLGVVDLLANSANKDLAETIGAVDSLTDSAIHALAEALGIADSLAKNGDLGKAETFSLTDSLIKAGAEAIAESLSIADGITTDGELTKIESFSITDGMHNIIILTETFSVADSEEFKKYMYMKIRKINVTFSAGNYESVIELED